MIVKYFEVTAYEQKYEIRADESKINQMTWWDFTNGGRVPTVSLVAIGTLHEYTAIAETFSIHFTADVVKTDSTT